VSRSLLQRCARVGALIACMSLSMLLSGCVLFHRHRHQDVGCARPEFQGAAQNLPPLKAPPGLNGPDTAQEIRIPPLTTAQATRPRSAPCLDWPPPYVSEPPFPPVRHTPLPPPPAPAAAAPPAQ